MPIISARYNEDNRWKRNVKKKKEMNNGDRSDNERVRTKWFSLHLS